ncbi:MAG: hypothetical protein ABR511_07815 [Acidimicrobiales bacterium]
MVVDGSMLATELRRRRSASRSLAESVAGVRRCTWLVGDLRTAPTALVILAAMSLTAGPAPPAPGGERLDGG